MNNYVFNQIDKTKSLSNMQFLDNQIKKFNYGENSILINVIDRENNEILEICFPKSKTGGLLKEMNKYGLSNKFKVWNIGIKNTHYFHVKKFDLSTGKFIDKKLLHYLNLFRILEINNDYAISQAQKMKYHDEVYQINKLKNVFKDFDTLLKLKHEKDLIKSEKNNKIYTEEKTNDNKSKESKSTYENINSYFEAIDINNITMNSD